MAKCSKSVKGLSLLEVIITLGIIAVVTAMALPRIHANAQASEDRGASQVLIAILKNGQSYSQSREIPLKLKRDGRTISLVDADNKLIDPDSTLTLPKRLIFNAPEGDFLLFSPSGKVSLDSSINPLKLDSQVVSIAIKISEYGEVEVTE